MNKFNLNELMRTRECRTVRGRIARLMFIQREASSPLVMIIGHGEHATIENFTMEGKCIGNCKVDLTTEANIMTNEKSPTNDYFIDKNGYVQPRHMMHRKEFGLDPNVGPIFNTNFLY